MAKRHASARYLHVVQTERERDFIERLGQEVVLCIETVVRKALLEGGKPWREPPDFRAVTGFLWSPIHADRYLPSFEPETQDRIASAVFEGLARVFNQHRIDTFLSEPVALFITHCALYLSRKHGARTLLWCNTWFPGWFYFADAIHISRPVRRNPMQPAEIAALLPQIEEFFDGVVMDRRGPAYHPSFLEHRLSPLAYFNQRRGTEALIAQPGLLSRMIQRARLGRARWARMGFPHRSDFMTAGAVKEHRAYLRSLSTGSSCYDLFPLKPDPLRVVYPLQYEPEASLLYFAPDFRDQPALVETALRALPPGGSLWVKEHPNQFGALGSQKWRELKRKYGALHFIHGHQSGRALIRGAGAVLTVSSSAGMDALALGKPTMVMGAVFYRDWPGAIPISSYAELSAALNHERSYQQRDNRTELLEALAEFGRFSYPGDPQPRQELFSEQNIDLLVAAIAAECSIQNRR